MISTCFDMDDKLTKSEKKQVVRELKEYSDGVEQIDEPDVFSANESKWSQNISDDVCQGIQNPYTSR